MEFLLIASAHFMALISPGPDFFLLMQASLRLPFRYGFAMSFGIACANGIYIVSAILGLEVIKNSYWIFILLKYMGGFYLLFLGIMLLKSSTRTIENRDNPLFLQANSLKKQFCIGFMSAILNPKNAIFYLSLFTVMVSVQSSLFVRILYGIWMMSIVFVWDCCVVMIFGREKMKRWLGSSIPRIEKISGAALALFGIFLPFV